MRRLSPRLPTLRPATLVGATVALASGLLLATLAAALLEPGARAETALLARWSTAVLLPAALALPAASGELALTALGVNLAAWLLPAGPQRGATVALLLAAGLALALAGRLRPTELASRSATFPTLSLLALALAALFSPAPLLHPAAGELLLGVAAPALLAGLATASLTGSRGVLGLVASAAAVTAGAGPGWTAAGALAVLAVGEQTRLGRLRLPLALPLLAGAALPLREEPFAAAAVAAAGVALATDRAALRLAAGALTAALLAVAPAHSVEPLLLLALAPAVLLAMWAAPGRPGALAGLACALLVALVGGAAALPAAAALALLVAPPSGTSLHLQASWSGWLLAATALAATYPWLHRAPLASALALWGLPTTGLPTGWPLLAPAVALAAAVALLPLVTRSHPPRERWLAPVLPVTALLLVGLASPVETLLGGEPVVLTAESPAWSTTPGPGGPLRTVAVDAALSHSTTLPRGETVAVVRIVFADGRSEERPLRTGFELDEWAARRSDVARSLGATAPAWVSWVPPGGEFFAQRYRARLAVTGGQPTAVEIRRLDTLPAPVTLALYRVEAAR